MAAEKNKSTETIELSVEEKLHLLYELQRIDSEKDKIKTLRGELPLEVQDLEDEIAGLETRIDKLQGDVKTLQATISNKRNDIINSEGLIKKYKEQQNNVRNNREYDSLSKEIEYQTLEIELSEKRIKEYTEEISEKNKLIEESNVKLEERQGDLKNKKKELEDITSETRKEEEVVNKKSTEISKQIEPRLLTAYKRIRNNAINGLAVVTVQRDSCGGCFAKIPPQRQLDIRSRKKIIVCEYCGRILVDVDNEQVEE